MKRRLKEFMEDQHQNINLYGFNNVVSLGYIRKNNLCRATEGDLLP